jgi:hypothetical protein
MRVAVFLFLIIVCPCKITEGQNNSVDRENDPRKIALLDSLKEKLRSDSIKIYNPKRHLISPYIGTDNRKSFIKDAPIDIRGLLAGVIVNDRHYFCIGGYSVNKETQRPTPLKGKSIETTRELSLKYLSLYYQYKLIDRRFFEWDVLAEIGAGKYNLKLTTTASGKTLSDRSNLIVPMGIGTTFIVRPVRWGGGFGQIGYRFVLTPNTNLNFNGFYYAYGVWINVGQVVKDSRFYLIKKPRYKKHVQKVKSMN